MITFTGCDGGGKSTLIARYGFNETLYKIIHYYQFVNKSTKKNIKEKIVKTQHVSINKILYKELIYATFMFCYFMIYDLCGSKRMVIDRTFFDVYVDLKSRCGGNYMVYKIILFYNSVLKNKNHSLNIYIETNSYETNLSRTDDETVDSITKKFNLYQGYIHNNSDKYIILNTETNSITQCLEKITLLFLD